MMLPLESVFGSTYCYDKITLYKNEYSLDCTTSAVYFVKKCLLIVCGCPCAHYNK